MVRTKRLSTHFLIFITIVGILCATNAAVITPIQASASDAKLDTPNLTVHFFNVGQGDATLFKGDNFTILVDAGRHDRKDVIPHLTSVGVSAIDLFIATHPHADHIGQCDVVVKRFTVHEVWMSGDLHTSSTFERCIDAILETDAAYHEPRAGETYRIGSAVIDVVHPAQLTGDFNNGSIAFRLSFGDVVFLFTGDAEGPAEQSMIDRGHDLTAHVLHVGHHGSRTSSTRQFIEAVVPEVAVYSAGADNTYGHPHIEVVKRFAQLGIPLYGTDTHGTITIITDGKNYEVRPEVDISPKVTPDFFGDGCTPGQINLNTASIQQLTAIIHVGPTIAERIIENRFFGNLQELTSVSGIGEKRLEDILAQGLACVA